ncbi:MAG TPA: response regulator transcription factor [Terriglobales bacterium]|nr:response regulator transcription factor [Terriglobales bacterium]
MPAAVSKANILVVDDEPQITRVLKTTLSSQGYTTRTVADGKEALQTIKDWPPDLIITDLRMPNMDGLSLCRHVREQSQVPIIILSVKGEERIKVEALDAGADDYVTKPFNINELLARVRASLRRTAAAKLPESQAIEIGDFQINLEKRTILVKGRDVHLTPKEFELMVYLARNPGKVITHRALLLAVWGPNSVEQPEYLRVFVGHLRKKLDIEEHAAGYIMTEPWIGYRFEPGE